VPGLEPRRADLAVAGASLVDEILGAWAPTRSRSATCPSREGLVLDYISRHRKEIAQGPDR
jgi:exopolyphosphatase/pppGpp-phosphohydrolase